MPNVVKIVLKFVERVFLTLAVWIVHLRPAGDSRLHQMSKMIERDLGLIALDTFLPLSARADQTHVAFKHIPQLRQLIEPQFAEPFAGSRDPRIVFAGVNLALVGGARLSHGAKLVGGKAMTFATHAHLSEDRRAFTRQVNQTPGDDY